MPSEHSFERADSNPAIQIRPVVIRNAKFAADLAAVIAAIEAFMFVFYVPGVVAGDMGYLLLTGYFSCPLGLVAAWAVDKFVRNRLYAAIERAAERPMQGVPRIKRVVLWALAAVILVGILLWIGIDLAFTYLNSSRL